MEVIDNVESTIQKTTPIQKVVVIIPPISSHHHNIMARYLLKDNIYPLSNLSRLSLFRTSWKSKHIGIIHVKPSLEKLYENH